VHAFIFCFLFLREGGSCIFIHLQLSKKCWNDFSESCWEWSICTNYSIQVLMYFKITFIKSLCRAYYVPFAVLLFWITVTERKYTNFCIWAFCVTPPWHLILRSHLPGGLFAPHLILYLAFGLWLCFTHCSLSYFVFKALNKMLEPWT
jgi:hypothetical protein